MNILFTSVGRRRYLIEYFNKEASAEDVIHIANSDQICSAFSLQTPHVVTPPIYSDDYIPFLLDYSNRNSITAIISLFDADLPIIAANRNVFLSSGVLPIVASSDVISICNDKWMTYNFLLENNISTPLTFIDLNKAVNAIECGHLRFPVFVKPRWGMGSIAIGKAYSLDDLTYLLQKTRMEILDTYLRFESNADMNNSVVIQETVAGHEFGLDIINDLDGNYQTTCVKKKLAMRSGETDAAITMSNSDLSSLGKKISNLLKHPANLDMDVFLSDSGITVLEMNARFGGGYPFSHLAGVNLPRAILAWLNNEIAPSECFTWKPGVTGVKCVEPALLKISCDI